MLQPSNNTKHQPQKHGSTRVGPRCGIWAFVAIGVDLQESRFFVDGQLEKRHKNIQETNGW